MINEHAYVHHFVKKYSTFRKIQLSPKISFERLHFVPFNRCVASLSCSLCLWCQCISLKLLLTQIHLHAFNKSLEWSFNGIWVCKWQEVFEISHYMYFFLQKFSTLYKFWILLQGSLISTDILPVLFTKSFFFYVKFLTTNFLLKVMKKMCMQFSRILHETVTSWLKFLLANL